ncbi:MAG: Zn-dependent protease [Thermodesulfovibrio sp. RBG_19FT_COMBO_42_12]|nr:MAG: Zn-dependent protease [Thermodesulfovibrio sp. RBG_19FT_COMBO_42_12]
MMEQLLEIAKKVSDKAEVYSTDSRGDSVSFEDAHLKDVQSSMQSGICLRIIKNNTLGFAYTKNLVNREELTKNALDSLKGGVEGLFELPLTKDLQSLDTYDPLIETLTNSAIVEECSRVCEFLSHRTKGQINISAYRSISSKRIINSSGTDLPLKSSAYILNAQVLYPYSYASLYRTLKSKSFKKASDEYLDYLVDTYNLSMREITPDKNKMKVLFLPETVYVLMWRLQSATSGMSIYQNISPVAEKMGERIFDEKLSIFNEPLNDSLPGAGAFDDEGTPCSRFPVIERGILRNFYYDLYFAQKLKTSPTGHGFKGSVSSKPLPSLSHLTILPGNTSFSDLIRSIDSGIIIAGALGAHSGNIPNGDFSIGVSPALYIENGEIVGNVKDVMVAGNIYDTLKNIVEIENTLHPCYGGTFPSLLFDNVKVTIKK